MPAPLRIASAQYSSLRASLLGPHAFGEVLLRLVGLGQALFVELFCRTHQDLDAIPFRLQRRVPGDMQRQQPGGGTPFMPPVILSPVENPADASGPSMVSNTPLWVDGIGGTARSHFRPYDRANRTYPLIIFRQGVIVRPGGPEC